MKYYIITGTSRGVGQALVEKLMVGGNTLFCISRGENKGLSEMALEKNIILHYFRYDLNNINEIEKLIDDIFSKIDRESAEGIYLINNAGIVTPVKTIDNCESTEIAQSINVNLISPMILVSEFIKKVTNLPIPKRIINISSGAGKHPYHGWSCYCSGKAGLDLFTKTVALEEQNKEHPVEILAFAPGIVDTQMQQEIRNSSQENFSQLTRFKGFKENGMLLAPNVVASTIIKLLLADDFQQGGVIDISEVPSH